MLGICHSSLAVPPAHPSDPPTLKQTVLVPDAGLQIDGFVDEEAWAKAESAQMFRITEQQRWPTEQTEVLVAADRKNLYFAFKVYDSQPAAIEALQTRRDGSLGFDDQVAVQIDPFLNYREISSFSVNAIGTQADSFGGGRARQSAWKGDWKAAVVRTVYGWSAEIAIPFEILNFQPGTDTIGINFMRYHHRTGEWSRWADLTVRNLPELMGRLTGLDPESSGKAQPWTFLPYVLLGRNIPDNEGVVRERLGAAGVDIRYQPRPNLTGVVSLRPDFSQIERAVSSVDFSYNEKFVSDLRPFFQEGAAYFGDMASGKKAPATSPYFYSNRIPNFDFGAKAFGSADGYQYGALATQAPGGRTDMVANLRREFGPTHSLSAMLVGTDRSDLRNDLLVLRGSGRQPSGLTYGFDAAGTRTDPLPGNGTFARGTLGWGQDAWTFGCAIDRYSRDFFPANGLLARDLLDTSGRSAYLNYYRDLPAGVLREVTGDLSWTQRETADGRLQRRNTYAGGSVELREQQIRLGAGYSAGPYRPLKGSSPGVWKDSTNDDRYLNLNIDFNTRSSWLNYGLALASGQAGGGDYRYQTAYVTAKPTRTTAVGLSTELLESFGSYRQSVLTASWDVMPQHTIAGRYINAYYGDSYRLAYVWRLSKNMDFFAVYDREPERKTQLSAKLLMAF
jgi:hypothetical protein